MAAGVYVHIKLHSTPGDDGSRHTLPELFGAFEEPASEIPQVAAAILKCQFVNQEAFLLQQVGFDLALLAPSLGIG